MKKEINKNNENNEIKEIKIVKGIREDKELNNSNKKRKSSLIENMQKQYQTSKSEEKKTEIPNMVL